MEHTYTSESPRGAQWAADVFAWLMEGYNNLYDGIIESKERRAKLELLMYARSISASDPELSKELIALSSKD